MQGDGAAAAAQTIRQIKIGTKFVSIGKLVFRDYAAAKEQAADEYKRSLVQTYTKNPDLVASLPKEMQATIIQEAFARAEKITADSLPPKLTWLPERDPGNGRVLVNTGERFFHQKANQWIEKGKPLLSEQEIEYSGWWLSQTNSGRIFAAWLAMRKCPGQEHWTLDYVSELMQDEEDLEGTANAVGELSQQRLGNSQPPVVTAAGAAA